VRPSASDGRSPGRRGSPSRRGSVAVAFLGICLCGLGATWIVGCAPETRYRVLSTVFDGVPPPGTPKLDRRRRRVVREEPPPPVEEDVTAEDLALAVQEPRAPRYETYAALYAALPQDVMRNIDWVAESLESPILDHDVHLDPGIPGFEVVFPHAAHTYWLRCDNCHPAIFAMRAGADPISMEKIFEGEYCGKCHGKVAFPPQTGCQRCHVNLGRG